MQQQNKTKFKIAHCIASMDRNAGGTTTAVLDILTEQSHKVDLELFTLHSNDQIEVPIQNLRLISEQKSVLDYSVELGKKLNQSKADLFHGHALWNLPMHQMSASARKNKKTYIISIHGMLHPWSLQQSSLKKKLAMLLYQDADLSKASCLHATSKDEAHFVKRLGYKNPIAVIPNGISIKNFPKKAESCLKKNRFTLLFLSRVHPQKGIELLLESWAQIKIENRENWILDITGMGEEKYIDFLKKKCLELNINSSVSFSGAVYNEEKVAKYHSADLFVLPSYTENFGMVIGEALSCGVPVITTKGTPWEDLEGYKAGAWIEIGVDALSKTLSEFLSKDISELEEMGKNGRKLIEEKYSIESVGKKFIELYQWILNKTEKPDFII